MRDIVIALRLVDYRKNSVLVTRPAGAYLLDAVVCICFNVCFSLVHLQQRQNRISKLSWLRETPGSNIHPLWSPT